MNAVGTPASTSAKSMAVFIDADNLNDATALDHVLLALRSMADRILYRRAYGRPESLKSIHAVLWRHGVRPVANLIVDKTTTDSALVIDAVEAVCTNDIDIVAICSGDADFVPLAIWLREKGCRVLCYSLANKIFANPDSFYDDVVLLDVVEAADFAEIAPQSQIARGSAAATEVESAKEPASTVKSQPIAAKAGGVPVVKAAVVSGPSIKKILSILPELKSKEPVHLSLIAKKLRDAGLLTATAKPVLLFRRHPAQFELMPERQPNTVRYRG
ncbi:NYN domain-containing protein [Variovorax sp. S2]|uniref:NYN domain-containing protein n=1 Tax=Variovorax sp. S12S4 TaxID=3029170 RepID=UPI00215D019D|nr:NYN domain-containing protein [Variovorax sp. S12S4]MCR8958527.1 NYN domain-containing protein [Variovorax sp. S12S4]